MQQNTFIGMGHNPSGPDLPYGFGDALQAAPDARAHFSALSNDKKEAVIEYIQSGSTDAEARIQNAIDYLRTQRTDFF